GSGYADAALANIDWTLRQQHANGWFERCCLTDHAQPLTHTIGYAVRGILEGFRHSRDGRLLDAARRAADGVLSALSPRGFLPGRLNANWRGCVSWACLTGSVQMAHSWLLLFRETGDTRYRDAAYAANAYVRRSIVTNGADPNIRGGVKGSFPVDGSDGTFQYLSWAFKFSIDANLLEESVRGGCRRGSSVAGRWPNTRAGSAPAACGRGAAGSGASGPCGKGPSSHTGGGRGRRSPAAGPVGPAALPAGRRRRRSAASPRAPQATASRRRPNGPLLPAAPAPAPAAMSGVRSATRTHPARGAHVRADGATTFSVWAPRAATLDVLCYGEGAPRRAALARNDTGVFTGIIPGVAADSDYAFSLDGGPPLPEPRSRWQPHGVNGASRVVDPGMFDDSGSGWRGLALRDYVIYELHVGTFTTAGTFDSVIEHLDALAHLGISAIELMPVAAFPGTRNWGYDGVALFAPCEVYGGPAGLRRLVNAAHARSIAVVLDVVYNHVGPEGNHLEAFGPYLSARH